MEGIIHRSVKVNGIRMHVAEKGEGPVVCSSTASRSSGTRGATRSSASPTPDTEPSRPTCADTGTPTPLPPCPTTPSSTSWATSSPSSTPSASNRPVFVVGHDWGAVVAWNLCLFRPDRVKALVNLSVPFRPRNPTIKPVDYYRSLHGDDHYICRFQEHGVVEEQFVQFGIDALHKAFFSSLNPGPFSIPKEGLQWPKDQISLPSWLSEEDIKYFASNFEKTGFTNPINYYRNIDLNWELTEPWTGAQIQVPTKFIVGDRDLVYNYPGVPDYVLKGGFKKHVPLLEPVVVMPGVGHWINQEKPQEITEHIREFIRKF
ncbi:uncharacterized protein M6B38_291670 [Iris pallida]|uniref:AB hydrolase-1 domain-containing protein n=1 Tax=Iris pallida TaxID=29817 RepID=A0AAX6HUW4_IRIPA|nr:uncharacterized protein M6B38_291670 [Iris pallida]